MANPLLETQWKKLLKDNPSFDDPGLADALKDFAKTEGKDVDERLEALEQVDALAEKAQKQNAKSRNKDVASYLDDVLKEAQKERQRLEQEDEDAVGFLDDEKAYGVYLKKTMKRLQKKPLYFAAAVGRKPNDHKIVFHKSQDGKKLLKTLKEATDLKKFAWGLAGGHDEQKSTLTLALEGPQIGGLKKKLELLLKYFKPLPFDTILLMVDGQIAEDLPDSDDDTSTVAGSSTVGEPPVPPPPPGSKVGDTSTAGEPPVPPAPPSPKAGDTSKAGESTVPPPPPRPQVDGGLLGRLNALSPRIKEFAAAADEAGIKAGADLEAKKAALAPRNRLLMLVRDCKGMIGQNNEQAEAMLADIEQLLAERPGQVPPPPPPSPTSPPAPPRPQAGGALVGRLNALASKIKEFAAAADEAGIKAGADLEAKKAALAPRNRLLTLVRDCKGLIGKNDEQAEAMLAEIEQLLAERPGDIPPPAPPSTGDTPPTGSRPDRAAGLEEAVAVWKSAQRTVTAKLKAVEQEIAAAYHPDVTKALIELKAVRSQLSDTPDTKQKVTEMEKYLRDDDAVQDICDLAEDIRKPLLAATARLKAAL